MTKIHTTNYYNTFIAVAEDCPSQGQIPPETQNPSTAALQFKILTGNPYMFTSDEVMLKIHMLKNSIPDSNQDTAKNELFSRGQACFRASPLTKRYGWGIHFDQEGRAAIYPANSDEYTKLQNNQELSQIKAVRNKRVK